MWLNKIRRPYLIFLLHDKKNQVKLRNVLLNLEHAFGFGETFSCSDSRHIYKANFQIDKNQLLSTHQKLAKQIVYIEFYGPFNCNLNLKFI